MQIFCLSKLLITSRREKLDDKYRYLYFENRKRHRELVKERVLQKELENCQNYAYTEIRIGKINENFYLVLFRNNTKIVTISLKKDVLTIFNQRQATDSQIIEIEVKNEIYSDHILKTDRLKKITLRCVKVFKRRVKANSKEVQNLFKDYANKINEKAAEFKDMDLTNAQEKAFQQLQPLQIPSESTEKSLKQKITDLYDAIIDLCHEGKTSENISIKAKYNGDISDETDIVFDKSKIYHARDEEIKDFSTYSTLRYDNIAIFKVNLRWFDAPAMTCLTFKKCPIFKTTVSEIKCKKTGKITKVESSWTLFEENVTNLTNLHILEIIDCELQEIPQTLFSKLPSKLDSLIFDINCLTEIPAKIEHVKNLKYFSVCGNKNLSSEGIPWDFLPEMIEVFRFVDTNISNIPPEARRLKNLKVLDAKVQQLQEGNVDSLVKEFGHVSIKNTTVTKAISTKGYGKFVLTHSNLRDVSMLEIAEDTGNINLSHNNMSSFILQPKDHNYLHLRILDLSNNNLTSSSISWGVLPEGLTHLDLSFNLLTEFGPARQLTRLSTLRLQNNLLTSITADLSQALFLMTLNLRNNKIKKLEKGFELKHHRFNILDLSNNVFNFKSKSLKEDLWNRLPKSEHLILNNNNLVELPCQLKDKFENLHVMGCELEYICPQIYASASGSFNINIANNLKLKLSFVPKYVYLPPTFDEPETSRFDDAPEGDERDSYDDCVILSDNNVLRNTSKYVKASKNVTVVKVGDIDCKCCAMCENADDEFKVIEQIMVADCRISLEKLENIKDDYNHIGTCFDQPGWSHGKWKTVIRTRICDPCREILKQRTDKQYEDYTADVNKKNKMKRLKKTEANEAQESNLEVDKNCPAVEECPKLPPIENIIYQSIVSQKEFYGTTVNNTNFDQNAIPQSSLLLSNEYAVDCFLNVAVNAIASMEAFAASICANVVFSEYGSTHHKLVEVLQHQVSHVRDLRQTLLAFKNNRQEDAGEAFFLLINSIDAESKKFINFSYRSVFECCCREAPIIQQFSGCPILNLTVAPNSFNTFNSMLEQWQSQNVQCSSCNRIATIKYPVEFGAEQNFLIVEINSWIKQQNSNLQISISMKDFVPGLQEIFGDFWDMIGAIQYIGTGEFGHYLWWKKFDNAKWCVVDCEKQWIEEKLLQNLKHYKILIFKKLDFSDINMEGDDAEFQNGIINSENQQVILHTPYDSGMPLTMAVDNFLPLENIYNLNQNFEQFPIVLQNQGHLINEVPHVPTDFQNHENYVVTDRIYQTSFQTQNIQTSSEQMLLNLDYNNVTFQTINISFPQQSLVTDQNAEYGQLHPLQRQTNDDQNHPL